MKDVTYDVFISYRRNEGFDAAYHLYEKLHNDGYSVFFDVKSLRSGEFDEALLRQIEQCKDFILVVDKHCFDRTLDKTFNSEYDWVRKELAHALKTKKNIIPVMLEGASFPGLMPIDIQDVTKMNYVPHNRDYYDAFYARLKAFLQTSSRTEMFDYYKNLATSGYDKAQYNLGLCFSKGDGVEQSYTEAVKWYKKAAEQGHAAAQNNLGFCYENGLGVQQSYKEAFDLFLESAKQGYAPAQYNLGHSYYNGLGVTKSYEEAVLWFKKAAEQGDTMAQNMLGACYAFGEGVIESDIEAAKWFKKAAEQGDAAAQVNLAHCYEDGLGVEKSYQEAVKWYRKAAEQGIELAIEKLTEIETHYTNNA